jgi:hypothetical protein
MRRLRSSEGFRHTPAFQLSVFIFRSVLSAIHEQRKLEKHITAGGGGREGPMHRICEIAGINSSLPARSRERALRAPACERG